MRYPFTNQLLLKVSNKNCRVPIVFWLISASELNAAHLKL